jgi:hypothetical protein
VCSIRRRSAHDRIGMGRRRQAGGSDLLGRGSRWPSSHPSVIISSTLVVRARFWFKWSSRRPCPPIDLFVGANLFFPLRGHVCQLIRIAQCRRDARRVLGSRVQF